MVPLVVLLTDERLIITYCIAGVTAEGHRGSDTEVTTMPMTIYRDARVQAGVRFKSYTCTDTENMELKGLAC